MNAPPDPGGQPVVSAGKLNFVLVSVFIDVLGIGLIIPVMPVLGSLLGELSLALPQTAGAARRPRPVGVFVPTTFARMMTHGTWVRYTTFRFGFYVAAAMQMLAVLAAMRHFRRRQPRPSA